MRSEFGFEPRPHMDFARLCTLWQAADRYKSLRDGPSASAFMWASQAAAHSVERRIMYISKAFLATFEEAEAWQVRKLWAYFLQELLVLRNQRDLSCLSVESTF